MRYTISGCRTTLYSGFAVPPLHKCPECFVLLLDDHPVRNFGLQYRYCIGFRTAYLCGSAPRGLYNMHLS